MEDAFAESGDGDTDAQLHPTKQQKGEEFIRGVRAVIHNTDSVVSAVVEVGGVNSWY